MAGDWYDDLLDKIGTLSRSIRRISKFSTRKCWSINFYR